MVSCCNPFCQALAAGWIKKDLDLPADWICTNRTSGILTPADVKKFKSTFTTGARVSYRLDSPGFIFDLSRDGHCGERLRLLVHLVEAHGDLICMDHLLFVA